MHSNLNRNSSHRSSDKSVTDANDRCLNFGFLNARSLFCHIDELRIFISFIDIDVLCVVETWLTNRVNDQSIGLNGYNILRYDRTHKRGGGVCLYYKKCFKVNKIHSSTYGKTEVLMAEMITHSMNILIVVCYNPPAAVSSDIDDFQKILSSFVLRYSHFIIGGDLNFNLIDKSHKFHNVLKTNNLFSVPFSPTRGQAWLDQCIVPKPEQGRIIGVNQYTIPDISDHDFLVVSYKVKPKRVIFQHKYIYDYNKIDYERIANSFLVMNWDCLYSTDNINVMFQFFYDCLYSCHKNCVPVKLIQECKSIAPWFNSKIANSMSLRDQAFAKFKKTSNLIYLNIYRSERNRVTDMIRSAKQNYYFGNCKETMKRIWNSINTIGIGKTRSDNTINMDPSVVNSYFCDIPIKSVVIPLPDFNVTSTSTVNAFSFSNVTEIDILKSIYNIKSNAAGHDKINLKFLKNILPFILSPLTYIINNCIMRSEFPDAWKTNLVIPVKKKQDNDSIDNLRPISLVSVLSKVFEIILRNQIDCHLEKFNYLNPFQSGFRNNHSTNTALLQVIDDVSYSLDKRSSFVVLVLLDFSKAFDCLNHTLLLQKLMLSFNYDKTALKLMCSYLTDRFQKVLINDKMSGPKRIPSGVFQGSILGPLLFCMFINDLPQVLKYSKYHLYADDCQIYIGGIKDSILDTFNNINYDLSKILDWSTANGISLNISKTQAIFISKKDFSVIPDIYIDNRKIPFQNHINNLGICINNRLTWDSQVIRVCGKINSTLYGLKLHKNICPDNVRILLAKTLVIPHVLYSEFLYISCDSSSKEILQVTMNNIVRYIHGLRKHDHISDRFREFFGCSMIQYFYYRSLLLIYKIIKNRAPTYLYNKIKIGLARNSKIILPVNRSTIYNNSPLFTIFSVWNKVPVEIRSVKTFESFKTQVFEYIKNKL